MKRPLQIVVTGAECSGKSTLTAVLANHFNEPWVPEYAVAYLNSIQRPYHSQDLIAIAKGQLNAIELHTKSARNVLLIDTGLEVIEVWHRDKLGPLPDEITALRREWAPDLFLLCHPDVPYEPHPLREDPERREELFEEYRRLLAKERVVEVFGPPELRLQTANMAIKQLLCDYF